jgi:hypothetical protein
MIRQIMLYYRFGSSNKEKHKNIFMQLNHKLIVKLDNQDNFAGKNEKDDCEKCLRNARKYQIKYSFWREINSSTTSNQKKIIWDSIANSNTSLKNYHEPETIKHN